MKGQAGGGAGDGEKQSFSKAIIAWNKSIFNDFNNNRYSNQCLPAVNTLVIIFFLSQFSLSVPLSFFSRCFCLAIIVYSYCRLNLIFITVFSIAYPSIYIYMYTDNQIIYVINY